jgi:hypothetical protein
MAPAIYQLPSSVDNPQREVSIVIMPQLSQ